MSSYNNHGGLWVNARKFHKTDPDFVGAVTIEGVEYKLVGWKSTSKHPNAPQINIRLGSHKSLVAPVPMVTEHKDNDDDIPF